MASRPGYIPHSNTVRLREADVTALNRELDAGNQGDFKRRTVRWDFVKIAVRIEMKQPGGVTTNLRYAARNLSSDGLGILHSSYVHAGTHCVVYLPGPAGEVAIDAIVMRCKHFKGLIHEVGLKFKQSINVREFVNVDPMEGRFTLEHVDPQRLTGAVLHIDDSPMDRRLVRHFLKDTVLNVVSVESAAEALARAKDAFDLVLLDNDLPDMVGTELAEQLRAAGLNAPIIMLTADAKTMGSEAARNSKVNAIVTKPVSREKLLQALGEFLLIGGTAPEGSGPLYTSLKIDDPTYRFVIEFIDELKKFAEALTRASTANDVATVRRLCLQLKSAAPALGFRQIGDAAEMAMLSLDATGNVTESMKPVRHLIGMCTRARLRDENAAKKQAA